MRIHTHLKKLFAIAIALPTMIAPAQVTLSARPSVAALPPDVSMSSQA
jgi:hypothetical protein